MDNSSQLASQGICISCGSKSTQAFIARASDAKDGRVNIVECLSCQFAWQYPIGRSVEQSVAHFEQSYYGSTYRTAYFDPSYKTEIARLEYGVLSALPLRGRHLLDVGGGDGVFGALAASSGWDVTIVDPSIDPARAPKAAKLKVVKGTTDDIAEAVRYDVATLWDVIEHVPEPIGLIQSIHCRVRSGGWVVIETGNYKCADRIEGGDRHWIFQLDHRWYFSPESLSSVLRRCGFEDVTVYDRVLRPKWSGTPNYLGPRIRPLASSLVRRPHKALEHIKKYSMLRRARGWQYAGLGIFCVAARRP